MTQWFFQLVPLALLHAMLHSLWQGMVLWLMVTAIRKMVKPSESVLYLLHAAAGLTMVCLFIIIFFAEAIQLLTAGSDVRIQQYFGREHPSVWPILEALAPFIAAGYLMAALLRLWHLHSKLSQSKILRSQALQKPPVDIRLFTQKLAGRMGISRPVGVYLSREVVVPLTIGILKPLILLPISLVNNLSVAQIEAIVVHELVHIRRHDYLTMVVLEISERILLFNPWMKLLCRKAGQYRESSCDEQVLQFRVQARDYAEALLACGGHQAVALAVSATGESNYELLQRIRKVMEQPQMQPQPHRRGWLAATIALALVLALLSFQWKRPTPSQQLAAPAGKPAAAGSMSAKAMWFWQNLPSGKPMQSSAAMEKMDEGAVINGGVLYLFSHTQAMVKSGNRAALKRLPKRAQKSISKPNLQRTEIVSIAPLPVVTVDPEVIFAEPPLAVLPQSSKTATWQPISLSGMEALTQALAAEHWLETLNQAILIMEQQATTVAFRLHELSDKELATAQVMLQKSLEAAEEAMTALMELEQAASPEALAAQKAAFRLSLQRHLQTIKKMGDEARLRKANASSDGNGIYRKKIRTNRSVDL